MKKTLIMIIVTAFLLGTVGFLASCGDEDVCAHVWGEWNIEIEASCEIGGRKSRACELCGATDRVNTSTVSHTYSDAWSFDANYHWHESTCVHTDRQSARAAHNRDNDGICQTCGHIRATQGMELSPTGYVITGLGDVTDTEIVLGRTYYNYPIIGVADGALRGCHGIVSILAQDNMKFIGAEAFADITTLETIELYAGLESIGSRAFAGLTELKTITFHGTYSEWEAIEKADDWDADSATYQLICTEN